MRALAVVTVWRLSNSDKCDICESFALIAGVKVFAGWRGRRARAEEWRSGVSRHSKALQLFLSHRAELLGYASRITGDRAQAEDVLQEAWIRFRATGSYRPLDEPIGYLRRIVRNLALDGQRRKTLEARIFADTADVDVAAVASDSPTPEKSLLDRRELACVASELAQMPKRMRIALEMHRVEGARLKHIAERLGMSVTTAHELVAEGVERCRAALRRAA